MSVETIPFSVRLDPTIYEALKTEALRRSMEERRSVSAREIMELSLVRFLDLNVSVSKRTPGQKNGRKG